MGSCWGVNDTLDNFILKLEKIRKKLGGDVRIQTTEPRVLSIPFERDELDKGIQLIERDGKVIIRG